MSQDPDPRTPAEIEHDNEAIRQGRRLGKRWETRDGEAPLSSKPRRRVFGPKIRYATIKTPERTVIRGGGEAVTTPAHDTIRVMPPHTIWSLVKHLKKNRRQENIHGASVGRLLKSGKLKIKNGEIVEEDTFGVLPDKKIGIADRIKEKLRKMFGFA